MKLEWRLGQFLARAQAYAIDVLLTAAIVLPTQGLMFWTRINPVVDDPAPAKVHLWVLATVSLLTFVLTLLAVEGVSAGLGLILGLLGAAVLFVVVLFGDRIPALAR